MEEQVATTGLEAVLGTWSTLTTLMGNVWELMTANAFLLLCVGAGLVPIGVSIFSRIKRAAKA